VIYIAPKSNKKFPGGQQHCVVNVEVQCIGKRYFEQCYLTLTFGQTTRRHSRGTWHHQLSKTS